MAVWWLSGLSCFFAQPITEKPAILVDKQQPAPATPPAKPAPTPKPIDLGEKPVIPELALPPTTLSATQIPPFLNILQLTSGQWAGAVSTGMEGMRLVHGPMTPDQTQDFEHHWAPMFDHPFQEGIDWLNKLNPLLGQFLAIRATMADTAIQFDGAWKEAVTTAAVHDEQGVREALSVAFTEKQMLVGMNKQLDQVIKEILALGDPPSATYHRRKKREEHDDDVKQTKDLIRSSQDNNLQTRKGRWVLTRAFSPPVIKQGKVRHKLDAAVILESDANSATVSLTRVVPGDPPEALPPRIPDLVQSATWKASWTTPPSVIPQDQTPGQYLPKEMRTNVPGGDLYAISWTFSAELVSQKGLETNSNDATRCTVTRLGWLSEPGNPKEEWEIAGEKTQLVATDTLYAGGQPAFKDASKFKRSATIRDTNITSFPEGRTGLKKFVGAQVEFEIGSTISGQGHKVFLARIYQYEWDPTGDSLQPMEGGDDGSTKESGIASRTPAELAEEIGFYEDNIKIIQANMAKDQEELARTTEPGRRSELVNRIIVAQANIQAEQDRILTLKSGQVVHTRTAWDEMQSAAFIRNSQAEVNEMAARDRFRVGMLRMAGRADPEQAERLRKFIMDHSEPSADSKQLQKMAHLVFNQVQGDLEAKAARSEEEAINADQNLTYIESVKGTCDKAMFVGALLGGHPVMVAYEGSIGFLEGPHSDDGKSPKDAALGSRVFEGLKRAGAWYNTATFVASEALEGYAKGGYIGGKENKGLWGAAERAGEAFLMAKSFEYAAGKIFGTPPKPGELPPRSTVRESIELVKYRQDCERAKSIVDDYKRTFEEYRRIQQFNASAFEMAAMEAQLRQKAASVHATFEAKLYLKEIYGAGKEASMLEDYVFRIGQNHEATREAWFRHMKAMGYEDVRQWRLMEFRNSASAGSPGMDHDMGVWDKGEKFFKDRVRVSTHAMNEDAQSAWRKAYHETTGYSAEQSFENITTSIHKEAYKDLSWIGDDVIKHVKVNEIKPTWAGQAADVTAVKNYEMFKSLDRLQAVIESGRGMAKDIQTKLLPVLESSAKKLPKSASRIKGGVDPATGKPVKGLIQKWSEIRDILKTAADNPVEADRKIRVLTGKSIYEVTGDIRDVMGNFGKVVSK